MMQQSVNKLSLAATRMTSTVNRSLLIPMTNHQSAINNNLHTGLALQKYITDTELVHRGVTYGYSAYPKRPNDPRIPSNPNFGKTHLTNVPQLTNVQPPTQSQLAAAAGQPNLVETEKQKIEKKNNISKSMKVYLERARTYNTFIKEQEEEFDVGRRHLANMMGINNERMTQADINLAISYLMPSGLFDKRARPQMKPPMEIYPAIKEAQFHSNGRPFHTFYYTGRANFYQTCFDIEEEYTRLKEYEDLQVKSGILNAPDDAKICFVSSIWLPFQEMKQLFLEKLETKRYESLLVALDNLANHPYSKLSKDFFEKFRKDVKSEAEMVEILPLKYDENGRPFMDAVARRKYCIAKVIVRGNGSGKIDINGKDILYFKFIQDREQVMTPLKFCGLMNKVDIECVTQHEEFTKEWSEDAPPFPNQVRELGVSSQSGAIRLAMSTALKSFVDKETVEKMRLCGLLTPDRRLRERKKWGQEGARRKYTWKKR